MQYKKVTELSKKEIQGLINCIKNWDSCYDEEFKNREIIVTKSSVYNALGIWIDIEVKYSENIDPDSWFEKSERHYNGFLYNDYSLYLQDYDDVIGIPVLEIAEYINNNLRIE